MQEAVDSGKIIFPTPRAAFVRECVAFYEPILPRPTEEEYLAITKALLEKGHSIEQNHFPTPRAAFVCECVAFYEPILPRPTEEEYLAITKALLEKYPCLTDKRTQYWVGTEHEVCI